MHGPEELLGTQGHDHRRAGGVLTLWYRTAPNGQVTKPHTVSFQARSLVTLPWPRRRYMSRPRQNYSNRSVQQRRPVPKRSSEYKAG